MQIKLKRYVKNPILEPLYWWEGQGVFNPAITEYKGEILMLYRAQGNDGISRFGLTKSSNGKIFKRVSKFPILEGELDNPLTRMGIEDPRITKIDDTYYITYICASVYSSFEKSHYKDGRKIPWRIRVGLTTTRDWSTFRGHGVILPDLDTKNATLLPGKFEGQYQLMHRYKHHLYLSRSSKIDKFDQGQAIMFSDSSDWQELKIGLGSAPIDFGIGWLSTFHGVSRDLVYRAGFMLFDKTDPSKILYRSKEPVLSPVQGYERKGFVDNIVFPSGMIIVKDEIFVYYGAGDRVVGLATIDAEQLRNHIENSILRK